MANILNMAVRATRAALRHARNSPAQRPLPDLRLPADRPRPDLAALAALVMDGLIGPADALFIVLVERDQHLDR